MFEIALGQTRHYSFEPNSDIVDQTFCEYFASKLIEAHVINRYRVEGRAFEQLLKDAARASGHQAVLAPSLNSAGHDLIIDSVRYQLKTEASRNIRPEAIHISKLMESAGTKKVTTRKSAVEFLPRIREHLNQYERIIVLRAFDESKQGQRGVRYDLIEIPKDIFAGLESLKPSDFKAPRPTGQTSAPLCIEGDPKPALTVVFDGSDNKIQLRNIRSELCRTHATFWAPYGSDIVRDAGLNP